MFAPSFCINIHMSSLPEESCLREAGCVFHINRTKRKLTVYGDPMEARPVILKLIREGWVGDDIKAIIFYSPEIATLVVGINLQLYLTVKPEKPQNKPKSFKELVGKNSQQ